MSTLVEHDLHPRIEQRTSAPPVKVAPQLPDTSPIARLNSRPDVGGGSAAPAASAAGDPPVPNPS